MVSQKMVTRRIAVNFCNKDSRVESRHSVRGVSGLDFSGLGRAPVVTFGLGIFWAFQFKNQAWGFQNLGYYNRPENL
jgi:hypothetical protein